MSVEEQNHGTTQPPETPELPFPQPPPPFLSFSRYGGNEVVWLI